ncbi:MAG: 6-phosphogluconolactonase [Rhizobium sp.]|nr:6-phosphogluconolactonase [Rhizobium sp.]
MERALWLRSFIFSLGSLNRPVSFCQEPTGDGISVLSFDEDTAAIHPLARRGDVDNPCFLTVDAGRSVIYANTEVHEWREGVVSAWHFDRDTNRLDYLNMQPTLGSTPSYSRASADGGYLYLVNYAIGEGGPDQSTLIYGRREDGRLTPPLASLRFTPGTGPKADRQERSHPHAIIEIPSADGTKNLLIVPDLGTDRIEVVAVESGPRLAALSHVALPAGAGPRHMVLHPNGRFLYVINELDSTLATLERQEDTFAIVSILPTVPASFRDANFAADLQISADGRFLYGSNRGHDSIAIFTIDPVTGLPASRGHVAAGGKTPRNFALTPSGRHLICANQDSDSLTIFSRDGGTGFLRPRASYPIGTPVCVRACELASTP